ncbi:hypothetical protein [Halopenitus persicus]|uniref:hypothetical protein n=1 Tax=Halopenitus persicus TaxID=1048396 RepID=UPI000BBA54C5|nr:hypothetical protein [Halopenitus persicus]
MSGDSAHDDGTRGDTFAVGIHLTDAEFRFVVRVPSAIDSDWSDPEAFQSLVERLVWERLDRAAVLEAIDRTASVGDTVSLGTITLEPDGTVVDASLRDPSAE